MDLNTIVILVFIGLIAGTLSGLIGIGGGIIIVPALIFLLKLSPLEAQGTSIALMLPPIGILAFLHYYKAGYVNVNHTIIIASTFILGGLFGAKIAHKLDQNVMKIVFGVILILAALKMIISGWKDYSS